MPIENIEHRQKQGRLFLDKLSKELNPKHKLYKLNDETISYFTFGDSINMGMQ